MSESTRIGEGGYTITVKPYVSPPNQWMYVIEDPEGQTVGFGYAFNSHDAAESAAGKCLHERFHVFDFLSEEGGA